MFNWLKKICPASRKYVEWRLDEMNATIQRQEEERKQNNKKVFAELQQLSQLCEEMIRLDKESQREQSHYYGDLKWKIGNMHEHLRMQIDDKEKRIITRTTDSIRECSSKIVSFETKIQDVNSRINSQNEVNTAVLSLIKKNLEQTKRQSQEAVWAENFHDAILDSKWLLDKTFFPGRWAAGYAFLYVLYRILDEVKPQKILELGLGQTTKLISQYASSEVGVEHTVVEHDPEWVSFFNRSYNIPSTTKLTMLDIYVGSFKDDEETLMYRDFAKNFGDKKYNLITVDAPFGGSAKKYSRTDIVPLLPNVLEESFAIIVDDCERLGEQNTFKEIEAVLEKNNISYKTGKYFANKDTYIITSVDWGFLTSL